MEAIRIGLSMMYFKGSQVVIPNYNVFWSLGIVFTFTNSVDPDEMPHFAAFHLGFHCFSKYLFRSFQLYKGLFRVIYPVNLCD